MCFVVSKPSSFKSSPNTVVSQYLNNISLQNYCNITQDQGVDSVYTEFTQYITESTYGRTCKIYKKMFRIQNFYSTILHIVALCLYRPTEWIDFTIWPNTNRLRIVITLTYWYGEEFPNRNSVNLQQIKDTNKG